MTAWKDGVLVRVLQVVEYHFRTGAELDAALASNTEGVLELGEVLAQACAAYGVSVPARDKPLGAVLARDAQPSTLAERGAVLQLADGRLALVGGRGHIIESAGPYMGLVLEPEPGRYVNAWRVPGIEYWRNE